MRKTLDQKLANIHANPDSCRDFILADAKDADMAFGLAAPGQSPEYYGQEAKFRSIQEYRQLMREIVAQGAVDIMLMSASSSEVLTLRERIFENSAVTPACRANDTTDIWLAGTAARYTSQPSQPFRSATIGHIMCGKSECAPAERCSGADLGLYSVTFNNDLDADRRSLQEYSLFRLEAERMGFRHFLEVFDPNQMGDHPVEDFGRFIGDHIARTLAGVTSAGRPLFLKIPYHGPKAMEMLVHYDRDVVVGILGGSAGTTYDAFEMLWEAKKYGARVALYGRKINNAENQLTFIRWLRAVADDQIMPDEAVRAYHGDLQKLGIRPYRSLEDDLRQTATVSAYSGKPAAMTKSVAVTGAKKPVNAPTPEGVRCGPWSGASTVGGAGDATKGTGGEEPDFSKMTAAEKAM
ncbi:MAG: hypothetical protein Q4C47_05285, partial [Planctomycetia bacterium]|nr:hypothetical protein [Planctomycetia bacterium]